MGCLFVTGGLFCALVLLLLVSTEITKRTSCLDSGSRWAFDKNE